MPNGIDLLNYRSQIMKKFFTEIWSLLKETYTNWNERDPFNNSIIIAWYTIFSLPGLLIILINIAGFFFGREAVTGQLTGQIQGMIGGNTAKDVEGIVAQSSISDGSTIATIISIATLLFGATGVFYQLQQILNKMWEVKPQPKQAILKLIKDRVFSFGLILAVAFLLLVSLALSAGLSALSKWVSNHLSESLLFVFGIFDIVFSLAVITFLFAAMFKFLPDAKIRWKDVWIGGALTGVLFTIAKFVLGLYFGKSDPASAYGAAGTIILIMLWVSYAGLILLFGAEFTQVYANRYGKKVEPAEGAISISDENKGPKKQEGRQAGKPVLEQKEEVEPSLLKDHLPLLEEPQTVSETLHRLVVIQNDRAKGYLEASQEVEGIALKGLFESYAKGARIFAAELNEKLEELGEAREEHSSTAGSLFRMWMGVQAKMTGNNTKYILDNCEEGENVALKAYEQVLSLPFIPSSLHQVFLGQKNASLEKREAIRQLKDKVYR